MTTESYLDKFLNSPEKKKEIAPVKREKKEKIYNREELTCCSWEERKIMLNHNADVKGLRGAERRDYFSNWK